MFIPSISLHVKLTWFSKQSCTWPGMIAVTLGRGRAMFGETMFWCLNYNLFASIHLHHDPSIHWIIWIYQIRSVFFRVFPSFSIIYPIHMVSSIKPLAAHIAEVVIRMWPADFTRWTHRSMPAPRTAWSKSTGDFHGMLIYVDHFLGYGCIVVL